MAARTWMAAAWVAAIASAVSVGGTAHAGDDDTAQARDLGLREARGSIQDVDKERNRVTVEPTKGSALTLQVDRTTTIFIDGRTGSLDEIRAGSEVRASYELRQGSNRAQWIEVSKREKKVPQNRERLAPAPGSPSDVADPANSR